MTTELIHLGALRKLKDMIGGDSEDLAELVDDFVNAFPEQMTQMRAQSESRDWGTLRITAHSCKSNARDMGATELSQLCADLELQCRKGAPVAPDVQLDGIARSGADAIAALKRLDLDDV